MPKRFLWLPLTLGLLLGTAALAAQPSADAATRDFFELAAVHAVKPADQADQANRATAPRTPPGRTAVLALVGIGYLRFAGSRLIVRPAGESPFL